MDKKLITIVTHDAKFHPDDVFAVATLLLILEKENTVQVIRSRDSELIAKAEYVVDVGGIYDPAINRFDHHQEGGAGKGESDINYSSFGLVWKSYGEMLCGNKEISDRIKKILVEPIDADDTGVSLSEPKITGVYDYNLCSFIYAFDPSWKEGFTNVDKSFMQVVSYAQALLQREILRHKDKLEARDLVEKIYAESENKKLIVLDAFYPTDEFLSKFPEPLFVALPRSDGTWVLKTVSDDEESFESRKKLPENWAGKRDADLEKVTGVPGAVFCHNSRFIAVAKTKEAILQLADLALKD